MTPEEKADDIIACEADPIHFIFKRVYTWDGETQTKRLFASGYPPEYQDKMKKLILEIIEVVRKGRQYFTLADWHWLKSRQTGATWLVSAIVAYCFLYIPNFSAILTSQSQNKLDNSNYLDYNTFVGKINYIIANLEPWLQPDPKDILRSLNSFKFLTQQSSIMADSGISPARGLQVSFHGGDEWAEQEKDELKLSSLREAVKGPNVLFSTPNGMDNSFYRIRKQGIEDPKYSSFNFTQFHWKEKMSPEQWAAWKEMKLREYNGDIGMFNRNHELSFEALVTGELTFHEFHDTHIIPFANVDRTAKTSIMSEVVNSNIAIVLDFGYYAPALLIARNTKRTIVFGSVLGLGQHPALHAAAIKGELVKWGIKLDGPYMIYGDPSGVSKPREQTGSSSFDLYRHEFKRMVHTITDRIIEGVQAVNGEFFNNRLFVLDSVNNVILGLHTATQPVDDAGRPKEGKYLLDHPLIDEIDCLRYGMTMMNKPVPEKPEPFYAPGGIGMGNVSAGRLPFDDYDPEPPPYEDPDDFSR